VENALSLLRRGESEEVAVGTFPPCRLSAARLSRAFKQQVAWALLNTQPECDWSDSELYRQGRRITTLAAGV